MLSSRHSNTPPLGLSLPSLLGLLLLEGMIGTGLAYFQLSPYFKLLYWLLLGILACKRYGWRQTATLIGFNRPPLITLSFVGVACLLCLLATPSIANLESTIHFCGVFTVVSGIMAGAITEEAVFHGALLPAFCRQLQGKFPTAAVGIALVATAVLFAALHIETILATQASNTFFPQGGVLLGLSLLCGSLRLYSRSIWPGILLHCTYNYWVPLSGY